MGGALECGLRARMPRLAHWTGNLGCHGRGHVYYRAGWAWDGLWFVFLGGFECIVINHQFKTPPLFSDSTLSQLRTLKSHHTQRILAQASWPRHFVRVLPAS